MFFSKTTFDPELFDGIVFHVENRPRGLFTHDTKVAAEVLNNLTKIGPDEKLREIKLAVRWDIYGRNKNALKNTAEKAEEFFDKLRGLVEKAGIDPVRFSLVAGHQVTGFAPGEEIIEVTPKQQRPSLEVCLSSVVKTPGRSQRTNSPPPLETHSPQPR